MRLAIISDTHGYVEPTQKAIAEIRESDVDLIIHCGDIGGPHLIELFADWPTHFVFGNVDGDREAFRIAISAAGQTCHGVFGELEIAGKRIAFLHGDDRHRFEETVRAGEWDLVCYGHTHRKEMHHVGGTLVLNPGALYRARPRTFAVVEFPANDVTFVSIS